MARETPVTAAEASPPPLKSREGELLPGQSRVDPDTLKVIEGPALTPEQLKLLAYEEEFKNFGYRIDPDTGEKVYFQPAFNFASTGQRVAAAFGESRPDEKPDVLLPWEMRIGGSRFVVPPINVNVYQTYKAGSLTGGALRQTNSPKFNSGYSETIVEITLYFPNHESIWGFAGHTATIDFDHEDYEIVDQFLSSLRGLIAQFRYAPFLPVRNQYLNQVHNITGVALQSMTVSTVPNFPFCVAVNLSMLKFNHRVYLPMIEHFDQAVHWGKFRQYMGRAMSRLQQAASRDFLTQSDIPVDDNNQPVGTVDMSLVTAEEALGTLEVESLNSVHTFDKMLDLADGRWFELYYPFHDPARIELPSAEDFLESEDEKVLTVRKNWWQKQLEKVGIDVATEPLAAESSARSAAAQLGRITSATDDAKLLMNYLQTAGIVVGEMSMDKFEEWATRRINENPSLKYASNEAKNEYKGRLRQIWMGTMYNMFLQDPAIAKYLAIQDLKRKQIFIQEWEVPMVQVGLSEPGIREAIQVQGVTVSMGNNLARLQVQMHQEPVHQHIGGMDTSCSISMIVLGEAPLVMLRRTFDNLSGLARLEHQHGVLGFMGIKNVLTALCGMRYCVPQAFEVETVPNYPHTYNVRLTFTDFDVFQQKREMLSNTQQAELINVFKTKKNPFLRIKQLWGAFNAYPDFPLAVRDDEGNVVGNLDPDWYFKAYETIDEDVADLGAGLSINDIVEGQEERANSGIGFLAEDGIHHCMGKVDDPKGEWVSVTKNGVTLRSGAESIVQDGAFDEAHVGNMCVEPYVKGLAPASSYQQPYSDGSGSPQGQYETMMKDLRYRDKAGRMIRAFPTYMLWIIDENGVFGGVKLFDNFYGLQSVIDFSVHESEDILGDTLVLRVSNIYSRMTTPFGDLLDESFSKTAKIINTLLTRQRRFVTGFGDYLLRLDTIELRPGVRVHLRMGYCADEQTEILSRRGWLRHDELTADDVVLTLNHQTGLSEWQAVKAVNRFWAQDEEMVALEGKFHSSLTTLGHRWPVRRRRSKGFRDPVTGRPTSRYLGDERIFTTSDELQTNDRLILAAPCAQIPAEPKHSDAFVELVAWFWTEGQCRSVPGRESSYVRISQSLVTNPENCQRIERALTALFGSAVETLGKGGRWASCRTGPKWRYDDRPGRDERLYRLNVEAAEALIEVAPDRIVSCDFIQQLTLAQLELFIQTSLLADRSRGGTSPAIAQKRRESLAAIELAAVLAGYRTHLYQQRYLTRPQNGAPYHMWVLSLSRTSTFGLTDHKPKRTRYTGITWCPTTANGTWFARRRGTAYFTGNSSNPNNLDIVFNGVITQVEQGDVMTITAQSDGIELGAIVNPTNKEGSTGKIDGCFHTNTPLQLWGGGTIPIGEVVRKRLPVTLVGVDEQGNVVPTKVLDWFDNGRKDEWLDITVEHENKSEQWRKEHTLRVTPNHHVVVNGRYQPAGSIVPGDELLRPVVRPADEVLRLIQAGLLGDGSVRDNGGRGGVYHERHRVGHAPYVEALRAWLGQCASPAEVRAVSGYGSEMVGVSSRTYPALLELRSAWYDDRGRKQLPADLAWIDDFVVAKWFMDDGSLVHSEVQEDRATFAVNDFGESDVRRLAEVIETRYGVRCVPFESKGWNLRVNAGRNGEIDRFWSAIAPHVVPVMRYKLPKRYHYIDHIDREGGFEVRGLRPAKVVDVRRVELTKANFPFGRKGYDVHTETQNYVAKGFLVHNSMVGFYLSEPRDLMIRLLTMGSGTFREMFAHATQGKIFSENRFGIRHFGAILYQPMSEAERTGQNSRRARMNEFLVINPVAQLTKATGGLVGLVSPTVSRLVDDLWVNMSLKRDYELFKRNIYPGNGSGVAQYMGGDLGEGALQNAMTPTGVDEVGKMHDPLTGNPLTLERDPIEIIRQAGEFKDDAENQDRDSTGDVIRSVTGVTQGHEFLKHLGITSRGDDDLGGFDEVSFRAQTHMKTVWDLFQLCAALLPNYIVAVRPFEDRSTVFYGKPHWTYTSGVIPLSLGCGIGQDGKSNEPLHELPDEELRNLYDHLSQELGRDRQLADFYKALTTVESADPTATTTGMAWNGGDPQSLPSVHQRTGARLVHSRGRVGLEMHLPTNMDLETDKRMHLQSEGLDPQLRHPFYMDRAKLKVEDGKYAGVEETGGVGGRSGHNEYSADGTKMKGDKPEWPGKPGAFGFLPPTSEQYYICQLWDGKDGRPSKKGLDPVHTRIMVYNPAKQKACICAPGDVGPGASTGIATGCSPDVFQAIGASGHGIDECFFGFVSDDTQLGPVDVTQPPEQKQAENTSTNPPAGTKQGAQDPALDPDVQDAIEETQSRIGALDVDWLKEGGADPAKYAWEFGHNRSDIPVNYGSQNAQDGETGLIDEAGSKAYTLFENQRSQEEAEKIWDEFRKDFPKEAIVRKIFFDTYPQLKPTEAGDLNDLAAGVLEHLAPEVRALQRGRETQALQKTGASGINGEEAFQQVLEQFQKFMWRNPYHRGWLVLTADTQFHLTSSLIYDAQGIVNWAVDGMPLGGVISGVTNFAGSTVGGIVEGVGGFFGLDKQSAREWNFHNAQKCWQIFITEGASAAATWMQEHADAGKDQAGLLLRVGEEGFKRFVEPITDAVDQLLEVAGNIISGVSAFIRLAMLQLSHGMSMASDMQKRTNMLNRIFNDSIYYRAGAPNSLTRLADNPFTREYGEPVVEVREPFQRVHFVSSFQHIIGNQIIENTDDVATMVTAVSNGSHPVTVWFDKGASPEYQKEKVVETGLFWDKPGGLPILKTILHPVESVRSAIKESSGAGDEISSKRVALWHLKESLKDIYAGELTILGDASIRPHDLVYMADIYERMDGFFEVEAVTHHFTPETGFVTSIVPNAIVTINDPARWSYVSYMASRMSVKRLRDHLRESLKVRADNQGRIMGAPTYTVDQLVEMSSQQILDSTQYSGGMSALIKDFGAANAARMFGAAIPTQVLPTDIIPGNRASEFTKTLLGLPRVQDWGIFNWVKDNLLDQHGCYIQYLTHKGNPMDAGMVPNSSVAVGQAHGITITLAGLRLGTLSTLGDTTKNRQITTGELLSGIGWSGRQIDTLGGYLDSFHNDLYIQLEKIAQRGVSYIPFEAHDAYWVRVVKVRDGDTIEVEALGGSVPPSAAIRMLIVDSPEDEFSDKVRGEETALSILNADDPGVKATRYTRARLLNQEVALRVLKTTPTDRYGRTLAFIFHSAPDGSQGDDRKAFLMRAAESEIDFDSYTEEGLPYTFNWELLSAGHAKVEVDHLRRSLPGVIRSGG